MTGTFQLYRKAIAALIGGVVPLLASFAPGVGDYLDPVTANVIELARVVVDALDRIDDAQDAQKPAAPGIAQTVIGRKDGVAAVISAAPVFDKLSDAARDVKSLALTIGGRK